MLKLMRKYWEVCGMYKKIITLVISAILISVMAVGCSSTNSAEKKYLGNWQDISNSKRFAKIYADTKSGYIWEDNEGKYTAKFEKDILKVNAKEFGIATVTYDESSKHLKVTLTDPKTKEVQNTEFKKE
jgi:hypothetical protein